MASSYILARAEYRIWRIAEFWARIDRSGGDDACWPWLGSRLAHGYGTVTVENKSWMAHRFAYSVAIKPIPRGMAILHNCDNPICCNPKHLRLGSQKENIQEMVNKGRYVVGDRRGTINGRSKLTDEQVKQIRELHIAGVSQYKLARMFDTGQSQISRIIRREQWSHI